ncbi:hypothetical protein AB0E01_43710 [Nocardia vinacea]
MTELDWLTALAGPVCGGTAWKYLCRKDYQLTGGGIRAAHLSRE